MPRSRELRLVVGVNQIVRDAGMIGFGGEERFENLGGCDAVGEGLVMVRFGGQQRQRVEDGSFVIVGKAFVHLLHAIGISFGAGFVVEFVGIAIEGGDGGDVANLAVGGMLRLAGGFDFTEATGDDLGVGLIPKLMPDAHGDAPVGHGAVRIVLGDLNKFLFGLFVPE